MTAPEQNAPGQTPSEQSQAKPASGLISLIRSFAINVVGAWLAYKLTAPHFPAHSPIPLLASVAVPLAVLLWELVRRRAIDGVAIIQLSMSGISAIIGVLAQDESASLVGMAFQAMGLGLVFGVSALFGRPLITVLSRQAMCGDDPEARDGFDDAIARFPELRALMNGLSAMWALTLCAETGVRLLMLQLMTPSSYILTANIMSYAVPGALVWLSIRIGDRLEARLDAQRALAAEGAAS